MRTAILLSVLGIVLPGLTLLAQSNAGQSNAGSSRTSLSEKTSPGVAVAANYQPQSERSFAPVRQSGPVQQGDDEPLYYEEDFPHPAIPQLVGVGLNQATVCRHDDLGRDWEFNVCVREIRGDSDTLTEPDLKQD